MFALTRRSHRRRRSSQATSEETRLKRWKRQCCFGTRTTASFCVSHVGLTCIVVAYSILGGFIFQNIEAPTETLMRHHVASVRSSHLERVLSLSKKIPAAERFNYSEELDRILHNFQIEIYKASKTGWDGMSGDTELLWSYPGALLYSLTVVTTIGYGHIAPKTSWGRLVTIAYAVIGIPLTLLCLANIGHFLGTCFRFIYRRFVIHFLKLIFLPKHSAFSKKLRNQIALNKNLTESQESNNGSRDSLSNIPNLTIHEEIRQVRVPVTVGLLIITLYILAGAFLFSSWEKDWSFFVGSYFCFITLTTIGFGDIVPGTNVDSWSNQEKRVLCAMYLIFGLALIAMCFDLLQEEVRLKFQTLARKLGLLETRRRSIIGL